MDSVLSEYKRETWNGVGEMRRLGACGGGT